MQLVPASSCTLSVPGIGSGNVAGMLNSTKGRGLADGCPVCPMPPPPPAETQSLCLGERETEFISGPRNRGKGGQRLEILGVGVEWG